jgi:hypothetical protein
VAKRIQKRGERNSVACGRWREDAFPPCFVRGESDGLAGPEIIAAKLVIAELERLPCRLRSQIEEFVELDLVAVERARKQVGKRPSLTAGEAVELIYSSSAVQSEIQDREAVWGIPTAANDTGSLPGQRVVLRGLMPERGSAVRHSRELVDPCEQFAMPQLQTKTPSANASMAPSTRRESPRLRSSTGL